MGPDSALVTGINGVPTGISTASTARSATGGWRASIPAGSCGTLLPPAQVIGCVVYPAAEVVEPGVIEHTYGDRFTLGEPDGAAAPRVGGAVEGADRGRAEGAGAARASATRSG